MWCNLPTKFIYHCSERVQKNGFSLQKSIKHGCMQARLDVSSQFSGNQTYLGRIWSSTGTKSDDHLCPRSCFYTYSVQGPVFAWPRCLGVSCPAGYTSCSSDLGSPTCRRCSSWSWVERSDSPSQSSKGPCRHLAGAFLQGKRTSVSTRSSEKEKKNLYSSWKSEQMNDFLCCAALWQMTQRLYRRRERDWNGRVEEVGADDDEILFSP